MNPQGMRNRAIVSYCLNGSECTTSSIFEISFLWEARKVEVMSLLK